MLAVREEYRQHAAVGGAWEVVGIASLGTTDTPHMGCARMHRQ